jgi:hypothetical protein
MEFNDCHARAYTRHSSTLRQQVEGYGKALERNPIFTLSIVNGLVNLYKYYRKFVHITERGRGTGYQYPNGCEPAHPLL